MMESKLKSVFNFDENFTVTEEVKNSFETHGYIILRNFLNSVEITKLRTALESDEGVMYKWYGRDDGANRQVKVTLWNQPGNDITGIIARSEKAAGTVEKLLGGEVYHYHSKVIMKEAKTGGKHVWHQDYGYWYGYGCIYPNMGTLWIAVDKATKQNGCLQILSGSHHVGRIEHVKVGDQMGADLERVSQVEKFCPPLYVELDPGDALFFHSNILHTSSQNDSEFRRWGFLVCYNRADNDPVYKHQHPQYTKLHKVPNSSILECSTVTDMTGKDFFGGIKHGENTRKYVQSSKATQR